MKWIDHIDGVDIFPKLAVYLRTHFADWQRKQGVQAAIREAASGIEALKKLNRETGTCITLMHVLCTYISGPTAPIPAQCHHSPLQQSPLPDQPRQDAASTSSAPPTVTGQSATHVPGRRTQQCSSVAASAAIAELLQFRPPQMHPPMPQPPILPTPPLPVIVDRSTIGGAEVCRDTSKRKNGDRGADQQKRKARRCGICLRNRYCGCTRKEQKKCGCPYPCAGKNSRKGCEFYT